MGTAVPTWTWVAFAAGITVLLVLDLRVLHRHPHALGVREAAIQSAGWITLGLAFGVVVLAWRGSTLGGEYFSAYLIEESLSIDNVFAWALILAHFAVPPAFQHRVLFWEIVGAIVLRVVFILGGVSLLEHFDWTVYVFGAFLLVTAARLVFRDDSKLDPNRPSNRAPRPRVEATHLRVVGALVRRPSGRQSRPDAVVRGPVAHRDHGR